MSLARAYRKGSRAAALLIALPWLYQFASHPRASVDFRLIAESACFSVALWLIPLSALAYVLVLVSFVAATVGGAWIGHAALLFLLPSGPQLIDFAAEAIGLVLGFNAFLAALRPGGPLDRAIGCLNGGIARGTNSPPG